MFTLQAMRFMFSASGIVTIGSANSGVTKDPTTQCSDTIMLDEDNSDWLHSNLTCIPQFRPFKEPQNVSTSDGGHGQRSFVEKNGYSEKKRLRDSSEQKRQRERERYSSMSKGEKDVCLHNNRQYKKLLRQHNSPSIASQLTPVMQTQTSRINRPGILLSISCCCVKVVHLRHLR